MAYVSTKIDCEIRSKPLIELLRIAEVKGIIRGWSVTGPSIVLRRDDSHILVRAVDASALLVRMMSEEKDLMSEEKDMMV